MIRFQNVTFTYPEADRPTIHTANLAIEEGTLCLVTGPTGAGKSTLLGMINGLVPRFTGGTLQGTVTVAGRDTRDHSLRDMADVVGFVGQDPVAGFTTESVEAELAYVMEQLGTEPAVMRQRVEETLDLLGLAGIRQRRLDQISGGEAQRVAIGSVLTAGPRVLVLDEPTSALDPIAAEEVLAAVTRLVHDLGLTVVLAEHRLERVVQYADTIGLVDTTGSVALGAPSVIMTASEVAPPVVELARVLGWSPPPLSVRDARRAAADLDLPEPAPEPEDEVETLLAAAGLSVAFGEVVAVRDVGLTLAGGSVTALMGRNGSGKSSLMWAMQGSGRRQSGTVRVDGVDPADLAPEEARRLVGLVPQTATDLLYLETVGAECRQADLVAGAAAGTCARLAETFVGALPPRAHPSDLSEGERLGLVLAIQLSAAPRVVLLDEPTRGLDYRGKHELAGVLAALAAGGRAVLVATHDVEFAADVADRVVVMAQGEIVADGPAASVLTASPSFAPQVARILAPARWLNVAQVASALQRVEG